jgi:CDP-diacylglycerol---serine O-phosphatidyltransferase
MARHIPARRWQALRGPERFAPLKTATTCSIATFIESQEVRPFASVGGGHRLLKPNIHRSRTVPNLVTAVPNLSYRDVAVGLHKSALKIGATRALHHREQKQPALRKPAETKMRHGALVTGAGGFIGHHLVKYLVGEGYFVRGADLKHPEYEDTKADESIADLRDYRRRRLRPIPVRVLVPNVITLLAICAGLTAIRLSTEGRMEVAVAAIVFAAVLDGIDGRVARMIKGQSKFGAELDSLADFVNFGVAPGLILYFWQLHELNNGGWIAAMVFAISGGLRLARFNATIDDPNGPAYAANFFTGVPAPAGAVTALLPIYLAFLGIAKPPAALIAAYTLLIAILMVSRLPVFSGKQMRMRVPPEMVLPVFVVAIFFIAILIGFPWYILSIGSVLYLLSLPLGWKSYKDQERAAAAQTAPAPEAIVEPTQTFAAPVSDSPSEERPERLH